MAGGLFAVGLVLHFAGGGGDAAAPISTQPPDTAAALVEGGTGPAGEPSTESSASSWSPGLMRMGFSFFVGFSIGYLMRAFLRLALIGIGLWFLVNAGFAHLGFLTVNWDVMEEVFAGFAARIGDDFDQFRTVVTGRLPQAGLGTVGLIAGFKKR